MPSDAIPNDKILSSRSEGHAPLDSETMFAGLFRTTGSKTIDAKYLYDPTKPDRFEKMPGTDPYPFS